MTREGLTVGAVQRLIRWLAVALLGLVVVGAPTSAQAAGNADLISRGDGAGQATAVDTAFATRMSVAVFDSDSALLPGARVVFSAPDSGASGTFAGGSTQATVTTNSTGLATAPVFTANGTEGSYNVTATVDGSQTTSGDPLTSWFDLTNTATAAIQAHNVSVAGGSGQAAQVNTGFAAPLALAVFDGSGAHLSGVEVVFSTPGSGASGTFAGGSAQATVTTGSNGLATAPAFTANGTEGAYSVTATVDGSQTTSGNALTSSFALTNTLNDPNGVPSTISLVGGSGQSALIGDSFRSPIEVVVFDGSNNHVSGAEVVFQAPGQGASASFLGGSTSYTTTTDGTGTAVSSGITADLVGGAYSITVTATKDDVSASTSVSLTNTPVATTTGLVVSPTGATEAGEAVTLTATVNATPDRVTPGGPVTFRADGGVVDGCADVPSTGGVATCVTSDLAPGNLELSAHYEGDASSRPSDSLTVDHTVMPDTTPPVVTVPDPITAEATSSAGATVDFTATATDTVDGDIDPGCTPATGSTFPLGATEVTCTASDEAGNASAEATFTVTVVDTTPPTLTVPDDISTTATGPTTVVDLDPTPAATDSVDGQVDVECDPAGATFTVGTHAVDCVATDDAGNQVEDSFVVTVVDDGAPVVTVPDPITAEATSSAGATVDFTATATDTVDGDIDPGCTPATGSTFPLGATEVTCTASDEAGNASAEATFTVTVVDTTPPTLTVPDDISTTATVVDYTVSATDAVDGEITPTCVPASGTTFGPGTNTVDCEAVDEAGNSTTASFDVTVNESDPAPPDDAPDGNAATVSLSTNEAQPGDTIGVTGRGFRPGETIQVTLNSDPVDLGRYVADEAGVARFTVRLPPTAPTGEHVIRLEGNTSDLSAEANLRITADTTDAALPDTGSPVNAGVLAGVGGLLLLGGMFLVIRRGRIGARPDQM